MKLMIVFGVAFLGLTFAAPSLPVVKENVGAEQGEEVKIQDPEVVKMEQEKEMRMFLNKRDVTGEPSPGSDAPDHSSFPDFPTGGGVSDFTDVPDFPTGQSAGSEGPNTDGPSPPPTGGFSDSPVTPPDMPTGGSDRPPVTDVL